MSKIFNLESLKAELDREFEPYVLDLGHDRVVLKNLMRIDESQRKAALAALQEVSSLQGEEGKEQSAEEIERLAIAVQAVLVSVADGGKGQKLVDAIGGDLMLAMRILEGWSEATQAPEAGSSPA